jgi:DNA-binding transcriptional MerR regulator
MSSPRYRIQAVAEMTGVPAATLRAWERRYGVPRPARTQSSYRLYSEDDVALVRRVRALSAGGLSAAEAARAALEAVSVGLPETAPQTAFQAAVARIVDAASNMDPNRLEDELREVLTLGSAMSIVERVLAPSLRSIGELWHEGRIDTAHEHLASEIIGNQIRDLLRLVQPSENHRLALLACFADEAHALPLYVIGFRFVDWGCRVRVLGPRTPPTALRVAIEALRPDVIGLSLTSPVQAARARELVDAYADACRDVPWLVGGAASEGLRERITKRGGIVVGTDPESVHRALQTALSLRAAQ